MGSGDGHPPAGAKRSHPSDKSNMKDTLQAITSPDHLPGLSSTAASPLLMTADCATLRLMNEDILTPPRSMHAIAPTARNHCPHIGALECLYMKYRILGDLLPCRPTQKVSVY